MATYIPGTPVDDIGHKPPTPPATGGGDDGRGGDVPDYGARLRRARLGLICGIATVGMVFISLTSAYVFRRGLPTFDGQSNSYVRDWGNVDLPWVLLAINTIVLAASSVTIELARRKAARQAALAPVSSNPSSSFAFLLTIAHAVHLAGGMIALIWAASSSLLHKPPEARRIAVDITAWYWHFMLVLWIYVFALLGLAR